MRLGGMRKGEKKQQRWVMKDSKDQRRPAVCVIFVHPYELQGNPALRVSSKDPE